MDLRAIKCSPLLRASDLCSTQSSSVQGRLHYGWKSSQLNGSLGAAFQPSLHFSRRSKPNKDKGSSACFIPARGSAADNVNVWKGRPIRTLLIDNYDSYTYNLYQLLTVINGAPPKVIKNDEFSWEDLRKLLCEENIFDNIVISPGPGSPMCANDIGVCLQVLQECVDIPILGVCLGHQALGYVNGAKVVHAPEPVHGRLSEVEHIDCPLFEDIPSGRGSGFQVVRYHSLVLEINSFPEDLIPTAWTVNSCNSVSLEAPLSSELEHLTASNGSNCSFVSDGRSFPLVEGTNQDLKSSHGSRDVWAYKPYRRQRTAENSTVSESISHIHMRCNTSVLAEEENFSMGTNFSETDCENKAKVIMAVSHRKRPHFGVQFHPESVATLFGKKILENFRDITIVYWKEKGLTRNAKDEALVKGHTLAQKVSKDLAFCVDSRSVPLRLYWGKVDGIASEAGGSEGIFCGLFGEGTAKDTFWLDSSLQPGRARFSFMGGKGGRLWKRLTYSMSDKHGSGQGVLKIDNNKSVEEVHLEKGFLEFLSSELESYTTPKVDSEGLPFDFWGGYVGYLGYELKAECGARFNQHNSKLPDACYFFIDQFIAVDHSNNDVYAVVLYQETPNTQMDNLFDDTKRNGGNVPSKGYKNIGSISGPRLSSATSSEQLSAQAWVKETLKKVHELVEGGRDMSIERRYSSLLATSSLGSINTDSHFVIAKSRKQYMEDVEACLAYIRDGESYELCLTTQLQKRVNSLDALGLYLTLRKMNPAPYAAWLHFGPEELCICCSSPERFLRLDQRGVIEAKPIKGTIPRGRSPAEDEALRSKLQYSEKDQAENLMIVDLLRNDLGRVCKPGSVHVPSLMAVESYATVHTMVSTVRGIKRPDATSIDCVRASFPGGSMTGAPKLRSMELLDSLECSPRGVYSGSIGFFSVNSSFDLNIVIRTLVIHKGVASIGAGGAIVALSDPGDEYEEMLLKTKAPVRAVSQHETLTNLSSQDIESGSLPHALLGSH
eukprot:c24719_g1_i1 orf=196-3204(-)